MALMLMMIASEPLGEGAANDGGGWFVRAKRGRTVIISIIILIMVMMELTLLIMMSLCIHVLKF